jgi:hypothetical protein
VKRVACDGSGVFQIVDILLENAGYYFVLLYLIADAETVLRCTEYRRFSATLSI